MIPRSRCALVSILLIIFIAISTINICTAASFSQSGLRGGIVGIVVDPAGYGVPNANITLWKCEYNAWTGRYHNLHVIKNSDYVKYTQDGQMGAIGQYAFSDLPTGLYNVTAEKNGYLSYTIVQVDEINGTSSANILLNGYTTQLPPAPTPGIPDKSSSPVTSSATPRASPGFNLFITTVILLASCLLYTFIRKMKK